MEKKTYSDASKTLNSVIEKTNASNSFLPLFLPLGWQICYHFRVNSAKKEH